MRKIFLVMIAALSLAVVAGRESVVRGGEQENTADPGSDAAQPKSAVSPRGKFDEAPATARLEPVEVRREYQISLGPWSTRLSLPETMDLMDLVDRARGLVGMVAILGVALFLSENPRAISPRVVFWGLVPQWGLALLVLRVPAGVRLLRRAGDAVEAMLDCALAGAEFVFGKGLADRDDPAGFVFAFRVLPTVIFVAALFAVLYHLGVMQRVVRVFAWVMAWLMGTSGAESLNVATSLLLGLIALAMLIAFLGLIALVNLGLGKLGTSLQAIFGWILSPVAYLLGVPWRDCRAVGGLLGTRTVLNELIAFQELGKLRDNLIERSFVIASFALCGFANFSSIGIQLGGIGALAPERRHDLARLGFRALLAGTMANFLSASIAGILL